MDYKDNVLTMFLAVNMTLVKGQRYTFGFNFTNPRLNQPFGHIRISAFSTAGSRAAIAPQVCALPARKHMHMLDGRCIASCMGPVGAGQKLQGWPDREERNRKQPSLTMHY